MLRHYIKTTLRGIKFHPFYSLISILGLAVGLASCILIFSYWSQQNSYDQFHSDFDRIYRISEEKILENGSLVSSASTYSKVGEKLKNDFAGALAVLRMHRASQNTSIQYGEEVFVQEGILGVENSFFDFFDFSFVAGSIEAWRNTPQSVILTETLAHRIFGNIDPFGKAIVINGVYGSYQANGYEEFKNYTVAGVIQDLPTNTHLDFTALISLSIYANPDQEFSNWGNSLYTYVKLPSKGGLDELQPALAEISTEVFPEAGLKFNPMPLEDIHLKSSLLNEFKSNGNEDLLLLLAALAILVLLIASCNYVNFATARAIQRQKEIGLRKIFWAGKFQLFSQLLTEAFLVNFIAIGIAILGIILINPILIDITGIDLLGELIHSLNPISVLVILVTTILLTGIYPAFLVSKGSFKGLSIQSQKQLKIQRPVVVFQFAISIFVIGFTLLISSQLNYMQESGTGFDLEKTLVITGPSVESGEFNLDQRLTTFQNELKNNSRVNGVTSANFIPGKAIRGRAEGYVRQLSAPESEANTYSFTQVDPNFISEFGLEMVSGRAFDPARGDRQSIIVNLEAAKLLGFDSPEEAVGQRIHYRMNRTPEIIGVIQNFHQFSLREAYQPIIFELRDQPDSFIYLKYNTKAEAGLLAEVGEQWKQTFPGNPFYYFYLDEFYSKQYQQDENFFKVFRIFSGLAIFLAALGFFGLTYFLATAKVKEIGIRKTLGAELKDIINILGKGTLPSLIIAAIVSIPSIFLLGNSWLENYAFRISIGWWMLIVPVLAFALLSFVLILIQSIHSYRANPIIALNEGSEGRLDG